MPACPAHRVRPPARPSACRTIRAGRGRPSLAGRPLAAARAHRSPRGLPYFFSGSAFAAPKFPLSAANTKPSVTLFNSYHRERIFFASSVVMMLSADEIAIAANMSANSCTIPFVSGISAWFGGRFFGLRM